MSVSTRDYFERARAWASTGLVLAGALLVTGSLLDWVSVDQLPETIPTDQTRFAEPFNGFDIGDGYITAAIGIVLAGCAVSIMVTAKSSFAWLAFFASMVAGALAISDYRDIDGLFQEFGGIGRGIRPGIGITLVAVGALLAFVSSVAAIAGSPRTD